MKRIPVLVLILVLAAGGGFAQASFDTFKAAFVDFADGMAGGLNLNSTIGNTWSDAYIGGFPHLGAGVFLGSTFAGKEGTDTLFNVFGQTPPEGLDQLGVPIPALGAMAKIGVPFLPIDVGLKVGLIPASVGENLEATTGVTAEYRNVGLSLRYALAKEGFLRPDLSLGLSINSMSGKVAAPIDSGTSVEFDDPMSSDVYTVTFSDPTMALEWETTTFDATIQVSKTILFLLRPYAGVGYTVGTSTVKGGVESAITVDKFDGSVTTPSDITELENAIIAAGGTPPEFTDTGFAYSSEASDPTFRVFGGLSLSLLITLDLQVMYVPATENFGGSLSARIQL